MIGNSVIMEMIANGTLWYYKSYDHKAACEELNIKNPQSGTSLFEKQSHYYIPEEVKENYIVWRVGKLRTMMFDPDGLIKKMYVGRSFKYAKRFFPEEVGKTIKPILNLQADKFNLIKAGLAVDKSTLNL